MSVFWTSDRVGYDGDEMHGHAVVNYWQPREDFEAEMDRQLAEIREGMLAERDRLSSDMERG